MVLGFVEQCLSLRGILMLSGFLGHVTSTICDIVLQLVGSVRHYSITRRSYRLSLLGL